MSNEQTPAFERSLDDRCCGLSFVSIYKAATAADAKKYCEKKLTELLS